MKKAYVAPVVVSILLLLLMGVYAVIWIYVPLPFLWLKIGLVVAQVGMAGVLVYVLIERIKEIRSGEEDDLSQY